MLIMFVFYIEMEMPYNNCYDDDDDNNEHLNNCN